MSSFLMVTISASSRPALTLSCHSDHRLDPDSSMIILMFFSVADLKSLATIFTWIDTSLQGILRNQEELTEPGHGVYIGTDTTIDIRC